MIRNGMKTEGLDRRHELHCFENWFLICHITHLASAIELERRAAGVHELRRVRNREAVRPPHSRKILCTIKTQEMDYKYLLKLLGFRSIIHARLKSRLRFNHINKITPRNAVINQAVPSAMLKQPRGCPQIHADNANHRFRSRIRLHLLGIMKLKPPPLRPKHCPPSKSSCFHAHAVTRVI